MAYTLPGHTVKGNIDLYGNKILNITTPVNDTDVSTKKYVDDNAISGALLTAGGSMTGQIDFGGFSLYNTTAPANDTDASTKKYVDDSISPLPVAADLWSKINKSGDTMTGVLYVINGTGQAAASYAQLLSASKRGEIVVGPVTDHDSAFYNYCTDGLDDYVQFAAAAAAARMGDVIFLMPGNYHLGDIAPTVTINFSTQLVGGTRSKVLNTMYPFITESSINGARIFVSSFAAPAFTCMAGSTIDGINFFYPGQNYNSTPKIYPETIYIPPGCAVTVKDVNCGNAYWFINATSSSSTIIVDNCYGFPLKYGIYADGNLGNCRVSKCFFHLNQLPVINSTVFDSSSVPNRNYNLLNKWVAQNGVAFYIAQADAIKILDCETGGYKYGAYFDGTNDPVISNYYSEDFNPVVGTGVNHLRIVGGDFGTSTYTDLARGLQNGINLDAASVAATITGTAVRLCNGDAIRSLGPATTISGCTIGGWGLGASSGEYFGIVTGGAGSVVSGNSLDGLSGAYTSGIGIYSGGTTVVGNTIRYTTVMGIRVGAGQYGDTTVGNSAGDAPGATVATNYLIASGNNSMNNAWDAP